jgi:hypothetical protein
LKKERGELAKQDDRVAYYARDRAHECIRIKTFKCFTNVSNVGGLRAEVCKTISDLPLAGHYGVQRTLKFVVRKYF